MKFRIRQAVKMVMQNVILPFFYQLGKIRPIDKRLVVFADSHHDTVPYSMEDLYHWFEGRDYRVLKMVRDCDSRGYAGNLVYMVRFMLQYARAHYVFLCDNFLPAASCRKRKDTIVVQMWHAGGILKKYGYDTERDIPSYYRGNVFQNYSLILTSAPACNRAYVSGMKADPLTVQALGLSRTDRFYSKQYARMCREQFDQWCPSAREKKIVLWAPTFRGNASMPEIIDASFVERLQAKLGDEWLLVVKVHPHLQKHLHMDSCPIATERLLPVADVLISDYSSVIYDYLLLERPIVLYVPDLAYYLQQDQFYIDFREMPGDIVTEECNLYDAVRYAYERCSRNEVHQFKEKYMCACDGMALERLIHFLGL